MSSTSILGITINAAGERIIDKEHRGMRIYARLGSASEEHARQRLAAEMQRVEMELQQRAARPRFVDAAARYLEESRDLRSADVTAWHVRLLTPYIGTLELNRIHDRTLERFIADRLTPRLVRIEMTMVIHGESNVCRLEWTWEVSVPEIGRSVFVIPPEAFKSKRAHVAILNDTAWSIVEEQRGQRPSGSFHTAAERLPQ